MAASGPWVGGWPRNVRQCLAATPRPGQPGRETQVQGRPGSGMDGVHAAGWMSAWEGDGRRVGRPRVALRGAGGRCLVADVPGGQGVVALLHAPANHRCQRRPAPGRVDVSVRRGRHQQPDPNPVQSVGRGWRPVRDVGGPAVLCVGRGDGAGAVELRPGAGRRLVQGGREPGPRALGGWRGRPCHLRQQPLPPCARCPDGAPGAVVRQGRVGGPDGRAGPGLARAVVDGEHAGGGVRGLVDRGDAAGRGPGSGGPGADPGVPPAHGGVGVAVQHHPATGRARARDVAAHGPPLRGRRECLDRLRTRRTARPRLLPHGVGDV